MASQSDADDELTTSDSVRHRRLGGRRLRQFDGFWRARPYADSAEDKPQADVDGVGAAHTGGGGAQQMPRRGGECSLVNAPAHHGSCDGSVMCFPTGALRSLNFDCRSIACAVVHVLPLHKCAARVSCSITEYSLVVMLQEYTPAIVVLNACVLRPRKWLFNDNAVNTWGIVPSIPLHCEIDF